MKNSKIEIVPFSLFDNEITTAFDRLYHSLESKDFGYELEVKSILFAMFFKLTKYITIMDKPLSRSPSADSIKLAMEYIQENYSQQITIEELSAICNMSQGHFCRLFKQYTLKTPVQYINNIRLSKAMELLISGEKKVLDVAFDTGFNSLSYFIGVFKEGVGITPTKFRKEYGKKASE